MRKTERTERGNSLLLVFFGALDRGKQEGHENKNMTEGDGGTRRERKTQTTV